MKQFIRKHAIVIAVAALFVGVLEGVALSLWLADDEVQELEAKVDPRRVEALEAKLAELETENRRRVVEKVPQNRPESVASATHAAPRPEIVETASVAASDEKSGADATRETEQAVAAFLTRLKENPESKQAAWRQIAKSGQLPAVIAELEKQASASPGDANILTDLGNALVSRLRGEKLSSFEATELRREAEQAFDKALAADDEHWEARFSKAMMGVFAPAALGKKVEAQQHFETLLEQQRRGAAREEHAHTYFFLANLYDGSGNVDESQALRAEAKQLFPQDRRFR